MRRLLLSRGEKLYRFIGFEFRDHADGSFYIETTLAKLDSEAAAPRLKISYHSTGRINHSGVATSVVFGDPIYAIADRRALALLSLVSIDELPIVASREDDLVYPIAETLDGRIDFVFSIGPDSDRSTNPNNVSIGFPGWFSLHIDAGIGPDDPSVEGKTHVKGFEGKYSAQVVAQDQALISFHQKRANTKELIMIWDPKNKLVRLIFAVPMRIPPRLTVEFFDEDLEAIHLEPVIRNTATAEIRFQVRGPGGILGEPPPLKQIQLDAEL